MAVSTSGPDPDRYALMPTLWVRPKPEVPPSPSSPQTTDKPSDSILRLNVADVSKKPFSTTRNFPSIEISILENDVSDATADIERTLIEQRLSRACDAAQYGLLTLRLSVADLAAKACNANAATAEQMSKLCRAAI
ncbi:MAG: hypothetical protein WBW92_00675 [Rhodanobacteraceae bacterium]